jgi:hypothetical protein
MQVKIINKALGHIFRTRSANAEDCKVIKVTKPYPGVCLFSLDYPIESYGVAENLETAIEYAEIILFDSLQNEPVEHFDTDWLFRFVKVDINDIVYPETALEKIEIIREYGIDVESAIKDYKKAHRNKVEYWLESIFNAHTCTLTVCDDLVYWRK